MKPLKNYIFESNYDSVFEILDKISSYNKKDNRFVWAVRKGSGLDTAIEFAKEYGAKEDEITVVQDSDNAVKSGVLGFFLSNMNFADVKSFVEVLQFKTDYTNAKGTRIWWSIYALKNNI